MAATSVSALYFDSFGNEPVQHSQVIREALGIPETSFHIVPYWDPANNDEFTPARVIAKAITLANQDSAERLLLIGCSMGGRLAVEVAEQLHAHKRNIALVLLSPVSEARDINTLFRAMRFMPSVIMEPLMRIMHHFFLRGVKPAQREAAAKYYEACLAIPWRIKAQELAYIAGSKAPRPAALRNIPAYVLYLEDDKVIARGSRTNYQEAFHSASPIRVVAGKTHLDHVEDPSTWYQRYQDLRRWVDRIN
jgi:pimeloyl-ACP methyl ester carboxylesterase